ncbi:hypothetical protein PISMIDRAFT_88347 [Pisolithus microcarpus 441]|uniref:Phosphatase activator n=1 Tax=Pisolithus microcarpus 441 TaxID=765257 RepID=A0A0C9ZVF8_9AGAM|nr:hypothetical protein PISMIDRAFT_88347 [Pisolithus microcarpus 441]
MSSSPITQVPQHQVPIQSSLQPQLLTRLLLDLRGKRFSVDRETIMNLPESVLLCLFPNGLVLSRQSSAFSDGGENEEDEEVYGVDFDPDCFSYVLEFFKGASEAFYGTATNPGLFAAQQHLLDGSPSDFGPAASQNPLLTKQAIIVLREELEYFAIPPTDGKALTDDNGIANQVLLEMKRRCGQHIIEKRNIFTALQRNVHKENNVAEQHLIDMLCMSGFDRDDEWGYRAMEPSRCCISSIALVLLKTGIVHHPPGPNGERPVTIDYNQMATAQKLLLFWRKPARKCWWDGMEVDISQSEESTQIIKLWARRVWTLELSLVGAYSVSSASYSSLFQV